MKLLPAGEKSASTAPAADLTEPRWFDEPVALEPVELIYDSPQCQLFSTMRVGRVIEGAFTVVQDES